MDSSEILSKIVLGGEDERGGISWAEEVEMVKPLHVEKKKLLKGLEMAQTVREFLRYPASHPYEMRLGDYLVMREGEEGMRRLRELKGYTPSPKDMEKLYMRHVTRKPGDCVNPVVEYQKFNVEALEEQAVKKLIRGWEAGPKIITRRDPLTKKKQHYVVLLAMKPGQKLVNERERAKQREQVEEQPSGTVGEPRSKVSCFSDDFPINILIQVPGQPLNPVEDQPMAFKEATMMEKNSKKKEKRLARSKRHDEKRAKSKRTKRSRLSARKARQEAKMLRQGLR